MNDTTHNAPLAVVRVADIDVADQPTTPWLVESLWGNGAVGVIGGAPKDGKSWLALEFAVAVASGRPCLGHFTVPAAGPVLLYSAEETPAQLRQRTQQLCLARCTPFDTLELDVIREPTLRIDRPRDIDRLRTTLAQQQYRLLILDPYVRLQAADENNATEVAAILATLRDLSRSFSLALLLVHHTRKAPGDAAGQALRGSSDFHAWGDSNLYLRRRGNELRLTVEHRAAAAPPPLMLALAQDPLHLEVIRHTVCQATADSSLEQRLLAALAEGPAHLEPLRAAVAARKQSVTRALHDLEETGHVVRNACGWQLRNA
jgi:hypothetical protein